MNVNDIIASSILFILGGAIFMTYRESMKKLPRGVRNNNPLNIEHNDNNHWQGLRGDDGRFVIFSDPIYGFRAAARVLRSYHRQGFITLSQMINRFAPNHENNTEQYIQSVSEWASIGKNERVNVNDNEQLARLLHSMARMEVGQYYGIKMAQQGVEIA